MAGSHRGALRALLATLIVAPALTACAGASSREPARATTTTGATVRAAAATAAPQPDWGATPDTPRYRPTRPPLDAAPPTRVDIDAIGVHAPVIRLGRNPDGTMQVPATASDVGWYGFGPAPGAAGPSVLAGHVDTVSGPAVFLRLRELQPGDPVRVTRADGTSATFVVRRVAQYDKAKFPTDAVFGSVPDAELRLITCGGAFDRRTGHYVANVVAFASLR